MGGGEQGVETSADTAHEGTVAVLQAIRRMMRAVDLHSHTLAHRYGLTGPQLLVLRAVDRDGALAVGEIAAAVHLSQATVTGIVNRLVKAGYVTRTRSEADRRRSIIELASRGREVLSRAPAPLQEQFHRRFVMLQDWEQTQMLATLQRVVAMFEADDLDASPVLSTGPVDASSATTEDFLNGTQGDAEHAPT